MRCLSRRSQIVLAILVASVLVLGPTRGAWGQAAPTPEAVSAPPNPQSEVVNPQSSVLPPRPELTGEVAERVEELEKQIAELREQDKYAEAIPLAKEVLAIRREHQVGWTNVKGEPAEWYEVGDARRAVEDLRLRVSLSPEQRAELLEAYEAGSKFEDLYAQGRYAEALELTQKQLEICRRVLGDDHADTL